MSPGKGSITERMSKDHQREHIAFLPSSPPSHGYSTDVIGTPDTIRIQQTAAAYYMGRSEFFEYRGSGLDFIHDQQALQIRNDEFPGAVTLFLGYIPVYVTTGDSHYRVAYDAFWII